MVPASDRLLQLFLDHTEYVSDRWEQYLGIYQLELAALIAAGKPLHLLEIGVQNGGSLQIWSKYLPPGSRILGVDIDEKCAALDTPPNARIAIGDAADPAQLLRLLGGETFDIIIDDGSHRSPDIIATFQTAFGMLNPGGLYFVEDLHCSYLKSFGGGLRKQGAAVEWFKGLVDALNADHLEDPSSVPSEEIVRLIRLNRAVARLSFYDSVAVIEKFRHPKTHPFRRVLTGTQTPVADVAPEIWAMPPRQIEAFRFSPATSTAFSSTWTEILLAAKQDVVRATEALLTAQAANAAETERLVETKRQLEESRRERASHEESTRQRQARSDALLRRAEAEAGRLAAEAAGLRKELIQRDGELQRLATEISGARAARQMAENVASDYAAKYNEMSMARAQAHAQLQAILTSTSWQMIRRVAPVAALVPPAGRRLLRRTMRVASWTAKGQLREKVALYRRARRDTNGHLSQPRPEAAPAHQPVPQNPPDQAPSLAAPAGQQPPIQDKYQLWWSATAPSQQAMRLQRRLAENLQLQPTFSVIVPVFQPPADVFAEMVASVQEQSYQRWELVLAIVDTGEPSAGLLRHAARVSAADPRIQVIVLPDNLGISGNSNAALESATGHWIVLLDHDDTISPDALFRFAESLNTDPAANFLYSDKDMIDRDGSRHFSPLMKPAWSPDIMLNANYLTHLCALRADLVRRIGGWDTQTDGAQDWDLFLRAYLARARFRHVPFVLYHWRQIPTSVSVGGFAAKPYAAEAQLRTLRKYLTAVGWTGARPEFRGHDLKISWAPASQHISLILLGSSAAPPSAPAVEVFVADADDPVNGVDSAIEQASGEVIIVLDAGFVPQTEDWIAEFACPLDNPDIAMVAGKVLDSSGRIIDFGVFCHDGAAYPAWRGQPELYHGSFGGTGWYRNVSATAAGAVAFRRTLWSDLGGFTAFAQSGRADLAFSLAAAASGRILANPFALFTATDGTSAFEKHLPPLQADTVRAALPDGDPFLNPNMEVATVPGLPQILPPPQPRRPPPHDYAAEASHFAYTLDVHANEITASIEACRNLPPGPVRHVLWVIPDFRVPFFGGIHTILRTAEFLRIHHGIEPSFAVCGGTSAEVTRSSIARAFPGLAAAATIKLSQADGTIPAFEQVDVAFATLWTTAFPLLRLRGIRRKCYFLQDWEPLFYPAGTLSGIVEATYRFGFHAICNTPTLAQSYRAMGGTASDFLPAVDTRIFNAAGRTPRRQDDPFVLFCYGRPTIPRNCFEALAEGLAEVKRKYADAVDIVFAGAEWNPADYRLGGLVRNLGLLSYAGTGQLYRAVDAGLVAMATRHPSYLPFELMASGAAVVTTRNIHTSWLLKDQENCMLCETTRSDIARAVSILIDRPEQRDRIANAGQELVARDHADWDAACGQIVAAIRMIAEP